MLNANNMKHDVKLNELNDDVKPGARPVVVEVEVREQFTNKQEFIVREGREIGIWHCNRKV